ncbi:uncharacterized protein GGS22DRAFT_141893 [Annulohypoxylon maeteangense]|uniref:uncharacterized protein n=1 Tax=Annulohypoxylon maeteangense TaxID=1927788 RepID=UPI0020072C0E|nr:uncharacterized protein GGS22DRAFT_141893 [Annulohypoxylon maeteangense]KAI0885291.1 hypothetical protein GGS22DRAFT_141893 [Annulohypoxylon maeteangense]
MNSTICSHCRTALRQSRRALRMLQPRTTSTGSVRKSSSSAPNTTQDLENILSKPSWSVRSLLPSSASSESTTGSPTITPQTLQHLLRLSALPPPKSTGEESRMLATLESQLQFVRAIRKVDTTGIEPLRAIRDETAQGMREQTIGLDQLKEALAGEDVVGHARRPRRRRAGKTKGNGQKVEENTDSSVEGWDVLGGASETVGRYFVVRTGSTDPTQAG